jgi:RNA recognition motif-containing protein
MSRTLYLGNLPDTLTEEELAAYCRDDGREIDAIRLIHDRETGRPRGFAFVDFAPGVDLDRALEELRETPLLGRRLTVCRVRPLRQDERD